MFGQYPAKPPGWRKLMSISHRMTWPAQSPDALSDQVHPLASRQRYSFHELAHATFFPLANRSRSNPRDLVVECPRWRGRLDPLSLQSSSGRMSLQPVADTMKWPPRRLRIGRPEAVHRCLDRFTGSTSVDDTWAPIPRRNRFRARSIHTPRDEGLPAMSRFVAFINPSIVPAPPVRLRTDVSFCRVVHVDDRNRRAPSRSIARSG